MSNAEILCVVSLLSLFISITKTVYFRESFLKGVETIFSNFVIMNGTFVIIRLLEKFGG